MRRAPRGSRSEPGAGGSDGLSCPARTHPRRRAAGAPRSSAHPESGRTRIRRRPPGGPPPRPSRRGSRAVLAEGRRSASQAASQPEASAWSAAGPRNPEPTDDRHHDGPAHVVQQLPAGCAVPPLEIDAVQRLTQELGGEVHVGTSFGDGRSTHGQVPRTVPHGRCRTRCRGWRQHGGNRAPLPRSRRAVHPLTCDDAVPDGRQHSAAQGSRRSQHWASVAGAMRPRLGVAAKPAHPRCPRCPATVTRRRRRPRHCSMDPCAAH